MFQAWMGRFQLELIYYFTYFSTVVPSNSCVFLSCRPFLLIQHFQQVLWVLKFLLRKIGKIINSKQFNIYYSDRYSLFFYYTIS